MLSDLVARNSDVRLCTELGPTSDLVAQNSEDRSGKILYHGLNGRLVQLMISGVELH